MEERLGYFIEEQDYLDVDRYVQENESTIRWEKGGHTGKVTPSTRRYTQVFKETKEYTDRVYDNEGNHIGDETTTSDEYSTKEINVWEEIWSLHDNPESTVEVIDGVLDCSKDKARKVINSQRDNYINGGVEYKGYTYQTDSQSVMDITGAVVAGIPTQWLTLDNTTVSMSVEDMQGLGRAVASHKEFYVYKARQHKNNIEACTTTSEVEDYMSNISWEDIS